MYQLDVIYLQHYSKKNEVKNIICNITQLHCLLEMVCSVLPLRLWLSMGMVVLVLPPCSAV